MTRVLLLSDIHSNIVALEAVLAEAGVVDAIWCLGDVVGYGPAPNECVERLVELGAFSLAGNHDRAVLGQLDTSEFNGAARSAIEWTRGVLVARNREWLEGLNDKEHRPEQDLTLVHGSPRHPVWEYVATAMTAVENMPYFDTHICLFGHTHLPTLFYRVATGKVNGKRLEEGDCFELGKLDKCLANPGSVGQPRDRDKRAAFGIYDVEGQSLTGYRVEYEIKATQKAMERARLPRTLIDRLDWGV